MRFRSHVFVDSGAVAGFCQTILVGLLLTSAALHAAAAAGSGVPVSLRTDDLVTPLGVDDPTPHFAWQLHDGRSGACQTAYQLQVATRRELLASGKADVWDSGRIASDQSVGVSYQGAALKPSTRYYWQIKSWDKDGKAYPASEVSWWETGLLGKLENWRAKWIGYQSWDEAAVRSAGAIWITTSDGTELKSHKADEEHIAYRLPFTLNSPVKKAVLFVTGFDVASAVGEWRTGDEG